MVPGAEINNRRAKKQGSRRNSKNPATWQNNKVIGVFCDYHLHLNTQKCIILIGENMNGFAVKIQTAVADRRLKNELAPIESIASVNKDTVYITVPVRITQDGKPSHMRNIKSFEEMKSIIEKKGLFLVENDSSGNGDTKMGMVYFENPEGLERYSEEEVAKRLGIFNTGMGLKGDLVFDFNKENAKKHLPAIIEIVTELANPKIASDAQFPTIRQK